MNEALQRVFADLFGLDEQEVTEDLTPESIELWDSLNHLRLVTALEEAFSVRLSMAEIEEMMSSVGRVRDVIQRHTAVGA